MRPERSQHLVENKTLPIMVAIGCRCKPWLQLQVLMATAPSSFFDGSQLMELIEPLKASGARGRPIRSGVICKELKGKRKKPEGSEGKEKGKVRMRITRANSNEIPPPHWCRFSCVHAFMVGWMLLSIKDGTWRYKPGLSPFGWWFQEGFFKDYF